MVRYHSVPWLSETTVDGNGYEPGWYQVERDRRQKCGRDSQVIVGGCWGYVWRGGEICISQVPEKATTVQFGKQMSITTNGHTRSVWSPKRLYPGIKSTYIPQAK